MGDYGGRRYDFAGLMRVAKVAVRNLNKIIDLNFYPIDEARSSNKRHRPVGVGVQGLADVFVQLRLPFDSEEAQLLNKHIFECIYFACLEASMELSRALGAYETFKGSPASRGELQFTLWGRAPGDSPDWLINPMQWRELRRAIVAHGLRNSMLTALMPTASTSHIMGNAESFEPFSGLVFERSTLAGYFKLVNPYLMRDLQALGLWSDGMKQRIIRDRGSVQGIQEIPEDMRRLYRTVWELKQSPLIAMAAARGPFVDQSQSMNLYLKDPSMRDLAQMFFKCFRAGSTRGYYTGVMPGSHAQQFTVQPEVKARSPARASEGAPAGEPGGGNAPTHPVPGAGSGAPAPAGDAEDAVYLGPAASASAAFADADADAGRAGTGRERRQAARYSS